MNASARLYHCARCHCQVFICRQCDRGNVYCAGTCAEHARKASLRRAGSRYRSTRRGRLINAARQQRPYPPAGVQINAVAYPTAVTGDLAISWAHRDRLAQGATLVDQTQASIGPEAGTTYTIRIIDPTGPTTLHTEAGLTGTAWTYTQADRQSDFGGVGPNNVRVEIESLRDGLMSLQMQAIDMTVSDV